VEVHYHSASSHAFRCYTFIGDREMMPQYPPTAVNSQTGGKIYQDGSHSESFSCNLENMCQSFLCHYSLKKLPYEDRQKLFELSKMRMKEALDEFLRERMGLKW